MSAHKTAHLLFTAILQHLNKKSNDKFSLVTDRKIWYYDNNDQCAERMVFVNNFSYFTPTKITFGPGTVDQVGTLAAQAGAKKVLLHYGGHSAEKSGVLDKVRASLKEAGVDYVELGGVVPNPHISKVYEGKELCQKEGVDFLLAVGGGSVIDSAKAIAYALGEPDKDVWELYDHVRAPKASYPVGAVVTMAAAGSEMSDSSVLTNEKTGEKRGCNSDLCRVKFAVMDPELTLTLPDYQTQAGCTDVMMHTMERYFTSKGNLDLTDAIAEGLLRTVMKNALLLKKDPSDVKARGEVMWASSLSHNGLTGCGNGGNDFACHGLEHELSGMFDVTHGAGLAAIWGAWARYVVGECTHRFVKFARNVMEVEGTDDMDTALKGIAALEDFFRSIGMPTNLKELGLELTDEQCATLAHNCAVAVGGHRGSAKVLYEPDMLEIYKRAR